VPILKTELSILDNEFSSIRERFETEMRKMEDEMAKFRSIILDHEKNVFNKPPEPGTPTSWMPQAGLASPLIQDGSAGKELKLRFDVSQYAPEEIVVKTIDNRLQNGIANLSHALRMRLWVSAKHEEKTENKSVYREYNREFLLPRSLDPSMITSNLSKDGILTIQAPLPAIEGPAGPFSQQITQH